MNLFIAYSRKDEPFLKKLTSHLKPLKRSGVLNMVWYDQKIEVGTDWERAIEQAIMSANIIILLISSDFLASEFAYHREMMTALDLHNQGQVRVIPVIARECLWENAPFAKLQVLPKDGVPLNSREWASEDSPYVDIIEAVQVAVKKMQDENLKRVITENQKEAIMKRMKVMRRRIQPHIEHVREFRAIVDIKTANNYFSEGLVDLLMDYYLLFTTYENLPDIAKVTADDYFVLAVANVVLNSDMESALKFFDMALDIDPRDYDALSKKGVCLIYLKRYEEAKKCFNKVIESKPDKAEAYYNMGIVHRRKDELVKAVEYYDEAIKRNKDYLSALINAGYILVMKGDVDSGIEYYRKALESDFEYDLGHYNLACAYAMKRDKINVLSYLAHAIRLNKALAKQAKDDTDFEWIRHDTGFKKIVNRTGGLTSEKKKA